jgi:hypothetical protein
LWSLGAGNNEMDNLSSRETTKSKKLKKSYFFLFFQMCIIIITYTERADADSALAITTNDNMLNLIDFFSDQNLQLPPQRI